MIPVSKNESLRRGKARQHHHLNIRNAGQAQHARDNPATRQPGDAAFDHARDDPRPIAKLPNDRPSKTMEDVQQ